MKLFDLFALTENGGPVFIPEKGSWAARLLGEISTVLYYIFAVCAALAVIFAVYLGFKLASAPDSAKRDQAKKRNVSVIAGLLIIIMLTTILYGSTEQDWFGKTTDIVGYDINSYSFGTTESKKQLVLNREDIPLTEGVEFTKGEGEDAASNINISKDGTIEASAPGVIYVNITYFNKEKNEKYTIAENVKITIFDSTLPPGPPPVNPQEPEVLTPNYISGFQIFANPVDYLNVNGEKNFGSMHIRPTFISSPFGMRAAPNTIRDNNGVVISKGSSNHAGVDLSAQFSSSRRIYAAAAGTVVAVRNDIPGKLKGSNGNYVTIRHDDVSASLGLKDGYKIYTRYKHLAYGGVWVKQGDPVQGFALNQVATAIGAMGNTGESSSTHLHFDIFIARDGTDFVSDLIFIDPFDGRYVYHQLGIGAGIYYRLGDGLKIGDTVFEKDKIYRATGIRNDNVQDRTWNYVTCEGDEAEQAMTLFKYSGPLDQKKYPDFLKKVQDQYA